MEIYNHVNENSSNCLIIYIWELFPIAPRMGQIRSKYF